MIMARRTTPTVLASMESYIESCGHWAPNTRNNNRSVLLGFVKGVGKDRYGDDRPIGNVTALQVERWFSEVVGPTNPSPASFNKVRTIIMQYLRYCTDHHWVTANLTMYVKKRPRVHKERMQLSGPELVQFLELATDPRDRVLVAIGINTGLRSSEITAIRIGDLNFDDSEVYVMRSKSHRDDRIGLTRSLDVELRRWLTYYADQLSQPLADDMYLVPSRFSPRLLPGEPGVDRIHELGELRPHRRLMKAHRIVQRMLTRFGVTVTHQEGLHTLRRSAARQFFEHCAEMGHDSALRSTAALLGHASVTTTEGYLGLSGDRRKRDQMLKGKDFLPFNAVEQVTRLRQNGS